MITIHTKKLKYAKEKKGKRVKNWLDSFSTVLKLIRGLDPLNFKLPSLNGFKI